MSNVPSAACRSSALSRRERKMATTWSMSPRPWTGSTGTTMSYIAEVRVPVIKRRAGARNHPDHIKLLEELVRHLQDGPDLPPFPKIIEEDIRLSDNLRVYVLWDASRTGLPRCSACRPRTSHSSDRRSRRLSPRRCARCRCSCPVGRGCPCTPGSDSPRRGRSPGRRGRPGRIRRSPCLSRPRCARDRCRPPEGNAGWRRTRCSGSRPPRCSRSRPRCAGNPARRSRCPSRCRSPRRQRSSSPGGSLEVESVAAGAAGSSGPVCQSSSSAST